VEYFFIGDAELATGFRFVGIQGSPVFSPEEALGAFRKITQGVDASTGIVLPGHGDCRVLIVTEEVADWLGEDLIQWQLSGKYPLIVELPGIMGRLEGRKTLVDSIREAIGIRV
jgi:V/A-type H+-transporting ATPase subunit F